MFAHKTAAGYGNEMHGAAYFFRAASGVPF